MTTRATRFALTLALLPLLAACAGVSSGGSGGSVSGPAPSPPVHGATSLTVVVHEGPGTAAKTWTLTCDPPGGSHPDPAAACAALTASTDPFAPVPKDQACTQIYGGPQTATVTGTYGGRPVNATFSRTDGCEISRWDAVQPLLVVRGGV